MNKHEATVIKVLADLNVSDEPTLTQDQEDMLARALDPEKEFLHSVEKLFNKDLPKK